MGFCRNIGRESLYNIHLHKKWDKDKIENYKRITVLNSAYKIYAMVLAKRLRKNVESNGILSERKADFRTGTSILHNVYVRQHVVDRELSEGGMVCAFRVDLNGSIELHSFCSINSGYTRRIQKEFRRRNKSRKDKILGAGICWRHSNTGKGGRDAKVNDKNIREIRRQGKISFKSG